MSENYIVHGYNFAGHETGHRAKYPTANLYFRGLLQYPGINERCPF
jgi:hypothetical protein